MEHDTLVRVTIAGGGVLPFTDESLDHRRDVENDNFTCYHAQTQANTGTLGIGSLMQLDALKMA